MEVDGLGVFGESGLMVKYGVAGLWWEEAKRGGPRFTRSRALAPTVCAVSPPPLQGGAASYLI